MPSWLKVDTNRPVGIIGSGNAAVVTNGATSGTLYIGGPAVSAGSNDFSIAAGATRVVKGPAWAIASTSIPVTTDEIAVEPKRQGDPITYHWVGGTPQGVNTGTSTTPTANTAYVGRVQIPNRCILTGIRYLIGATGGTDKATAVLYDNRGNPLAWHTLAGTTVGTSDTFQSLAFITPYEIIAPGNYYLGVAMDGNTARIELSDGSAGQFLNDSVFGGTAASAVDFSAAPVAITAPTAVGNVPIAHTY